MHKKIEAELVALAHSILEIKNNHDVNALHKKATLICEKLAVLKFVEAYIDEMPIGEETKNENIVEDLRGEIERENLIEETVEKAEECVSEAAEALEEEIKSPVENIAKEKTVVIEDEIEVEFIAEENLIEEENEDSSALQFTLQAEFKDAISADVATELFERATKENPVITEQTEVKQKSLNDSVFSNKLQVGLNDRIAFVKYLFDGSQEDFNRVLSQLNSFKTEEEAKTFVKEFVKPDYNWSDNLEYEERLMNLIERKFV